MLENLVNPTTQALPVAFYAGFLTRIREADEQFGSFYCLSQRIFCAQNGYISLVYMITILCQRMCSYQHLVVLRLT
jgi:hypothetical protein